MPPSCVTMSTAVNHHPGAPSPSDLRAELLRLFGHRQFLGAQEAVISQVMAGIDTVAVMPTGAGKSLCYQLPAMLLPGVTVVISPLIALMKDQYDSLPADVYERTTFINSSLDIETLRERMGEIFAGRYKLVYCAPERLRQQPFVDGLRRADVSLVVVDEAHCVSMWGHDFRPDYLFLGKVIPSLGSPIVLALTATATPEMRDEISEQLGRKLAPVVASVFRPNLYYEVETLPDKQDKMHRLVDVCKNEQGSGVVYARSRETCEQLAAMLRRAGVKAAHYHAGLPAEERSRVQESFMTDRTRVIVATIAFGMGIDKSNVRFIVHFSPPDTLEGYVQESGRAGRDGRPARCVLLISPGDGRNLSRWSRQEQLKVDDLRAIYREVKRRVPEGKAAFANLEEIEKQAREAAGSQIGDTTVRVAVSLLEKVGLIRRRYDAPRDVWIALSRDASLDSDRVVAGLTEVTGLGPGQSGRFDTAPLAD
ncbi:MAG TPA: ATP-dependent DNA helicase RecQ, partial [Chloroflexia bacterium]|nr:ATP-dependent DNA helicase RecQ [Chloroflexia bacterium]